jgi:hypothetical protein
MAEENLKAQVVLTVDDSGATKSIDNLTGAINNAGASAKSWAQQVGDLKKQLASVDPSSREWAELALQYKELGGSSKVVSQSVEDLKARLNDLGANVPTEPVKNFRQQIKDLTNELQTTNLPKTSEEYQNLKRRLEQLKDAQKDFNEEIGANAGPAFESAGNNLRNLQSRLGSLDFGGAADSINGLAKNIKGLNFSGATEGSGAFTKSVLNLGKALLTNPIFLIGSVIALIITNFDKLANIIPGVGTAFEVIGSVISAVKDAITAFTDAIGLTAVAAADAVDSAISNLEGNQKKLDNARRLAVANAQKTGGDIKAINDDYRKKEIAENENLINKVNALEKKGVLLTKEQADARSKAIAANTEINIKAAEEEASEIAKTREDAAKAEADRIAKAAQEAKAAAQRRREQIKQNEDEVNAAIKEAQEMRFQATLTDEDRELRQLELKYNSLQEKAGKNTELLKQLEEAEFLGRQQIRDKYSKQESDAQDAADAAAIEKAKAQAVKENELRIQKENDLFALEQQIELNKLSANEQKRQKAIEDLVAEYDAKFLLAKNNASLTAELDREQKEKLAAINQEFRDTEKAADEKSQKDRIDSFMKTSDMVTKSAQDGISTLLSLNEAFSGKDAASKKRTFERNQKLQIAQTAVNTYQSATAAYASQVIPGDPTSVVRGVIAAAAAVAAGLANVAKIKAQKFDAGTPPSPSNTNTNVGGLNGPSTNVNTSTVPQFNPLANAAQPINTTPRVTYVLASDVSTALEARERVQDLARL